TPAGDAHRHRERRGPDPHVHPAGQPGPSVRDHPGDQRDRVGRRRSRCVLMPSEARRDMTATVETAPTTGIGRVARVIGPVVDIELPSDAIPAIYNALTVEITLPDEDGNDRTTSMTLEVAQHLGESMVRAIALKPTDGLVRGAAVTDTGAPISVPVGDVTK